jgi:hypothetical protein
MQQMGMAAVGKKTGYVSHQKIWVNSNDFAR